MAHKKKERDMVAEARARNKRVRKSVSKSKTGVGKGISALKALRKKTDGPKKFTGY